MPVNEQLVTLVLVLSLVIKVLVDLVKQWTSGLSLPGGFHRYTSIVIALGLGVLLSYETDAGILKALELQVKHTVVDTIVTGFFIAGGGDVIYELVSLARSKRLDGK